MEDHCTEKRFLSDVKNHNMNVIRDDGINRHISFARDESSGYYFDLITWNGNFCICGDCGTYVFSRISDMFEFFRGSTEGKLKINTGYWEEKLRSVSIFGGCKKFDSDLFEENIKDYYDEWEFESDEQKKEVWKEINDDVLCHSHDGDYRAIGAAMNFKSEHGYEFTNFWEYSHETYTFSYLWCLYAIVWGIRQYDLSAEIVQ